MQSDRVKTFDTQWNDFNFQQNIIFKQMKNFFNFGEVLGYFFRKKDSNRPTNFNIKAMHTINKISILIFLFCISVLLFRLFTR